MTTATDLIAAERERQITVKGYTPDHDREHSPIEFLEAAISYASPNDRTIWPWEADGFKPEAQPGEAAIGTVRDLVKAAALLAAVIDTMLAEGGEVPC